MLQIIQQTDEEKLAMYMKLTKKELAKMLIEANKHLSSRAITFQNHPGTWDRTNTAQPNNLDWFKFNVGYPTSTGNPPLTKQ